MQRGNTILSCGEGPAFNGGIREFYRQLFPQYELKAVLPDHTLLTRKTHFDIGGIPLLMVHNGVRPLAIHTDRDLPAAWEGRKVASQRTAFEIVVNIQRYVSDSPKRLPRFLDPRWPEEPARWPEKKIRLARLDCGPDWNAEPLAYERLRRLLASQGACTLEVHAPVKATDLEQLKPAVALLAGVGKLKLSDTDGEAICRYVAGGGTLLVEAIGGNKEFAESSLDQLRLWWPREVVQVAANHEIATLSGHEIELAQYRSRTKSRLANKKVLNLQHVMLGNRSAVYYSAEDLTLGLLDARFFEADGYEADTAYAVLRNILLTAGRPGGASPRE